MRVVINNPYSYQSFQQQGAFGVKLGQPVAVSPPVVVEPTTTQLSAIPPATPVFSIPVTDYQKVGAVTIDNVVYALADTTNPGELLPNEFIWNPYNKTIVTANWSKPLYTQSSTVAVSNYASVSQVLVNGVKVTDFSYSNGVLTVANPTNAYLTIQVLGTQSTVPTVPKSIQVAGVLASYDYPTDFIDKIPNSLKWLSLLGSFSYSLSLEQDPSGSLDFETWFSNKPLVIRLLAKGAKFESMGIGWRVESLSFVEKMRSEFPHPKIVVNIGLTGCHQWLDTEVPLVTKSDNDDSDEEDCRLNSPTQPTTELSEYRTLTWLCNKARGSLIGMNGKIPVPPDISPEEGRIPRSEIQARLRQNGKFLDLFDPTSVQCKDWDNTKQWTLQEEDILSEIQVQCQGGKLRDLQTTTAFEQNIIPGLPNQMMVPAPLELREEDTSDIFGTYYIWPKQKVTGQFLEKDKEQTEENQSDRPPTLPEYRPRQRKYELKIEDPDNAAYPPQSVQNNDLSIAFWKAGQNFVKTRREIRLIDGMELEVKEQKYGFKGPLASDVYNLVNGIWQLFKVNPNNFWGIIEDTTTTHFYSTGTQEGVYLGYTKTGWKLHVFKTEPDINVGDLEAAPEDQYPTLQIEQNYINLGDDIGTGDVEGYELAKKSYRPQIIPIFEEQRYMNEPMGKYYKDAQVQGFDEVKICLPNGQSQRVAAIDKTYQQPFIVTAQSKYSSALAWLDDPRNPIIRQYNNIQGVEKKGYFPPLATGTDAFEYRRVKIHDSQNRTGVKIFDAPKEDSYTAYNRSANTGGGGGGFISQIAESRTEEFEGRPETSKRLPPLWERVEEEDEAETEEEQNRPDPKLYRYKVWTPGAPDRTPFNQLASGSMSFPYAERLSQVHKAIRTTLDIENARNSYTESFTVFFNPDMRPGDRLTYYCNGEKRTRRILSISSTIGFQGEQKGKPFCTGTMQLSVGYPVEVNYVLDREKVPVESATEEQGSGVPLEVWLDPLKAGEVGFVVQNPPSRLYPNSVFFQGG